jgi:hypothetical protein
VYVIPIHHILILLLNAEEPNGELRNDKEPHGKLSNNKELKGELHKMVKMTEWQKKLKGKFIAGELSAALCRINNLSMKGNDQQVLHCNC